ncbi:efflux ABC transporter, permease protein [Synechococcus sp. PCC 7335]|uniref:ABC transporter permease n=1 Tax=Synechococcus sp. (strain ATCC 29403 / PCC 7335) TaxID=91464 RepID=UPI00017EC803|nr:ABC transporter permease [Synechococcus sp. PCC 7335]EDX82919.1 efflux ABC transporter, permease protein [Synechococcus sp. PCC 7335]
MSWRWLNLSGLGLSGFRLQSLDRKLLRDLLKMRGQILAIVLIVTCGIGSLVTMMSAYSSLKLTQQTYYDRYRFAEVFVQMKRAPVSLLDQVAAIPGVQTVRSRVVVDVTADVPDLAEPATVRLVSIPEQPTAMLNDLFLRSGHYPERPEEVLASEAFVVANQLSEGDTIGAVINGRWQALKISGVALSPEYIYEIRGSELMPDNQRFGILWMPRETLATAFDLKGAFNDLSLTLLPTASEAEVLFQLDHLLTRYGGLGAFAREDQISHRFISDEIRQLSAQAVLLPSIFLGVAAFLLNLLLARLVSTQRDQIAVMKAFGYSNAAVGGHYLKLVMVIVAIGSVLGLGLGAWLGSSLTRLYAEFYRFPILQFEIGTRVVIVACLVSAGAATLGAALSVRRALQLPPAEAMRPEPPAVYKPTLIEKLGLQHWVSPVHRIILRNLERRPLQAGFSIVGIAIAVAILVLGRYFQDAMAVIVDVQFRTIQREDVTLVFNQPLSSQAQFDLYSLPGVLQAEPFRVVPARLRFEHRTHLTGVTGVLPEGEMRLLLDSDRQPIRLPPEGIALSEKLADILQIQPGELLTLEVLEGARPKRQVQVNGIFNELIGLSAYMDMGALNRLMREGTTISGAYLMVDQRQQQPLYQQLKQTPAVASVSLRETVIQKFEEIIGQSMGGFNQVLVGFASVIAFGVVYNATRMALSERNRELATLRIIGFTQGEIAFILLGEQFVLLCAAIPLGFGIGFGMVVWLTQIYDWELFRFPLVVTPASYAFAFIVISLAALASGWIIRRQLDRLDLVAVLQTRE